MDSRTPESKEKNLLKKIPDDILTDKIYSYLTDAEFIRLANTTSYFLKNTEIQNEIDERLKNYLAVNRIETNRANIFIILRNGRTFF